MTSSPLGCIIIAANDEASVIARTLAHLTEVVERGLVDVVVVCNGCRDATADIARGFLGVRVLEIAQPSKVAALRAGDLVATPGPRMYLDADVELTGVAALETFRALERGALAGRPPHGFDTDGAHWAVRRWYAVRERLPSVSRNLWGAGCYALSEGGRARFDEFPDVLGDDLFINSLFGPAEIVIVDTDPIVVHTPRAVTDLLRIKGRSYRSQGTDGVGDDDAVMSAGQRAQLHDLWRLLRREPHRAGDVGVYVVLVGLARLRARWGRAQRWERDISSRQAG